MKTGINEKIDSVLSKFNNQILIIRDNIYSAAAFIEGESEIKAHIENGLHGIVENFIKPYLEYELYLLNEAYIHEYVILKIEDLQVMEESKDVYFAGYNELHYY
jgi:hypothetical protein